MRFTKIIWLLFPYLLLLSKAEGNTIDNFSPITSIQGLSQNEVRCIHQDKAGFLWIGTQDGLNRYDGYEFKKYSKNPFDKNSLSNDRINAIVENSAGKLWIGTDDGIDLFDPFKNEFVNYNHLLTKENSSKFVSSILVLEDSKILITTLKNIYLLDWDKKTSTFKSTHLKTKDEKLRFYQSKSIDPKNILISTNKGFVKLNLASPSNSLVEVDIQQKIIDFTIDKSGKVWFLALESLNQFNPTMNTATKINSSVIKPISILTDRYNHLWVGTAGNGLYESNNVTDENENLNFVHVTSHDAEVYNGIDIMNLYESKEKDEDIVWCGTSAHGLIQYSRSKHSFSNLNALVSQKSQESNLYYALLKKDNTLYTGTSNGLYTIDLSANKAVSIPLNKSNQNNSIHEIFEDSDGNMWLGSSEGLYFRKKGATLFTIFDIPKNALQQTPSVFAINEDHQKNIWIGTNQYLATIQNNKVEKTDSIEVNNKKSNLGTISTIIFDENHNMWLGTTKGLLIKNKDRFQKLSYDFNNKSGLNDNLINDIFISSDKTKWVATPKGLSKIIEKQGQHSFVHYNEKHGLLNAYVYGILEDNDHNLWLSTNKGLYKFNPSDESFISYSANDGLGNEEFNSGAFFNDKKGNLYFGGINLLVEINTDKIISNLHKPKLQITDFRIDDVPLTVVVNDDNTYLTIPYSSNVVTIELSSLDFTNPSKNQYAYRIRDLHDDWIYIGSERKINLFNLPYRKHIIEFKSSNNEGVWNDGDITKFFLDVRPPFWCQWWFYSICLAAIASLIYTYYKYKLNAKLAIQKAIHEENERVRKMASQDLHDEFGNSLTRITILTEQIKSRLAAQKYDEASSLLTKIADNSSRLYQGTKDFIWSIKSDSDNLFEAITRIKDYAEDAMGSGEISFSTDGVSEELKQYSLPKASSRHVVMIIKEAISNTIKHAQASETILGVRIESGYVKILWLDNGKGITLKNENGNGLENMRSRATTIKAKLEVESEKEDGTGISLIIPIHKDDTKIQ